MNVSLKQNIVKQTENVKKKGEEFVVDKRLSQNSEPQIINKNLTGVTATKSADDVIKPNNIVQHHIVNNKKPDYIPDTLPNVPDVVKSTKSESVILSHVKTETSVPSATIEEDAFAHHKKATENMVAQWTEEVIFFFQDLIVTDWIIYPGLCDIIKIMCTLHYIDMKI